jgi:hypothetical protein
MLFTASPAASAMTYTLEPTDLDGVVGVVMNVTQQQLAGTLCPCTKIPYPADGLHTAQGAAALASAPLQAGDIVLGYSGGSVVISAYLNSHTPPPGVRFVLLGDTSNPNGTFVATGLLALFGGGIPLDTPDPVTIISRQYDGWADWPNNIFALGYQLAVMNAVYGANTIHNDYTEASLLNNAANVTWTQGNITYELVPTQNLPINRGFRDIGLGWVADALDALERPLIDAAYTNRPSPTAAQLAASTSVQAKVPSPNQLPGPPEPVVTLSPPPTASVLAGGTSPTPAFAAARVATKPVTSASTVSHPTAAPRPGGVGSVEARPPGSNSPRRGTNSAVTNSRTTKPAEAASHTASKSSLPSQGLSGERNDGGNVSGSRGK